NADTIKFDLWFTPAALDAEIVGGKMTNGHFDKHLADAVDAAHLAPLHAVLFMPDPGGNAASHQMYLVVDANGVAGYQAGEDLVIGLGRATNMDHFSIANFDGAVSHG
ncbi:MAG TPA: hypothetical protein VHL34_07375, partial [Rhizomicrobium sp.]|nr:hypothetical protein [Rhizomicrobium sp.]